MARHYGVSICAKQIKLKLVKALPNRPFIVSYMSACVEEGKEKCGMVSGGGRE
jgi:hypothetical protein